MKTAGAIKTITGRTSCLQLDHRLEVARLIDEDWLKSGYNPVIFCRHIQSCACVPRMFVGLPNTRETRLLLDARPSTLRRRRYLGKKYPRILSGVRTQI